VWAFLDGLSLILLLLFHFEHRRRPAEAEKVFGSGFSPAGAGIHSFRANLILNSDKIYVA